jgi:oligopeptide transport system ATP-binding protein
MPPAPLLEVRNLSLEFHGRDGVVRAVSQVDLDLAPAETLAVVGESGSGKTQMLLSILGLAARSGQVSGSARLNGEDLLRATERRLTEIRGSTVGFVFQDPMTSLNPYLAIGTQLIEVFRVHKGSDRAAATARAIEMLKAVHIPDPERRLRQYPHHLSGGMRQRVAIAMALMCQPAILMADEPTTALDVTVQGQVLALLREIKERFGTAVILVTHDLGVIAELADRVDVMYAGRIVERGSVEDIFYRSRHPYTVALKRSVPSWTDAPSDRLVAITGSPPNPLRLPPGCAFAPRCAFRLDVCDERVPALETVGDRHAKACFYEGPLGADAEGLG